MEEFVVSGEHCSGNWTFLESFLNSLDIWSNLTCLRNLNQTFVLIVCAISFLLRVKWIRFIGLESIIVLMECIEWITGITAIAAEPLTVNKLLGWHFYQIITLNFVEWFHHVSCSQGIAWGSALPRVFPGRRDSTLLPPVDPVRQLLSHPNFSFRISFPKSLQKNKSSYSFKNKQLMGQVSI